MKESEENNEVVQPPNGKKAFSKHTAEDYREFFLRGLDSRSGLNANTPWLYLRAFAVCLIIFALFVFAVFMTGKFIYDGAIEYFAYPSLLVAGGVIVNLPVLIFIYELYPARDLSFIKLCFIMIVCTVIADLCVSLGYCAWMPANEWISVGWTAVLEETSKAVPALLTIFLLKQRNPLFGFLIGSAVGVGMSISEDMGYLFIASWENGVDIPVFLLVTLLRSVTSLAGHVIWTGLIGWAFVKFRRPLLNFKFWIFCLFSGALHYLFDFPYEKLSALFLIASVVAALFVAERIVRKERKAVFAAANESL